MCVCLRVFYFVRMHTIVVRVRQMRPSASTFLVGYLDCCIDKCRSWRGSQQLTE